MPAPTVTVVAPTSGQAGGASLVTITGTDFDIPAALGDPLPDVQVEFGGEPATDIEVRSATKIVCRVPAADLARSEGARVVAVTVENVDAGPNQGTGTLLSAYTYSRPDLSAATHLATVIRTLVDRISERVLANTVHRTHVDYDDAAADTRTAAAKLPVIILRGPALVPYTVVPEHGGTLKLLPDGSPTPTDYELYERPIPVDLVFEVHVQAEHEDQFYGLMHAMTMFPERLPLLSVPRDPLDLPAGTIEYPIDRLSNFSVVGVRTRSNVLAAVASWRVEGVFLDSGDLRAAAPTIDTIVVTAVQAP